MTSRVRLAALLLPLACAGACFENVRPAPEALRSLTIWLDPDAEVTGPPADVAEALRDGLPRDLASQCQRALSAAGLRVVDRAAEPHALTGRLSARLESHRVFKGTVGTAVLDLRDANSASAEYATTRVDSKSWSADAFAHEACSALADQISQSPRLLARARSDAAHAR
jgi:hypothetical protein